MKVVAGDKTFWYKRKLKGSIIFTLAPCINLANGGPTSFLGADVNMPQVCIADVFQKRTCWSSGKQHPAGFTENDSISGFGLMMRSSTAAPSNRL